MSYEAGSAFERVGRNLMGIGCSCFGLIFFGIIALVGVVFIFGLLTAE